MRLRTPAEIAREEPRLVRQERALNKSSAQQLLAASVQKLQDATRAANSGPTRLEAAYDAILYCGLAIFAARGYRVAADAGHHKVALEGMAAELKLAAAHFDEIDQVREIRNTKYSGLMHVNPADLTVALEQARRVMSETELWFRANRPDYIK